MSSLSIICVYNNQEVLEACLLKGLEAQKNKDYELILLDNRSNQFSSAAKALNYGAKQAKSNYLVFSHLSMFQDRQCNTRKSAALMIANQPCHIPPSTLVISSVTGIVNSQ